MTHSLKSIKQQVRGYLEMEQLFGASEIHMNLCQKRPVYAETPKKEPLKPVSSISLMVVLETVDLADDQRQLLEKMLKTLEIDDSQLVITDLKQRSLDQQLEEKHPKTILALGKAAEFFGFSNFTDISSKKYKNISVLATWDPEHLMYHSEDKKHSWQILLLLKSLI